MGSRKSRRDVIVQFPGKLGKEAIENVSFEPERPLPDQVKGLCTLRGLLLDDDDNQWLLVAAGRGVSEEDGCVVISDVHALSRLPPRSICRVCDGRALAGQQLERLENAADGDAGNHAELHSVLGDLLRSLRASAWFAEEIIDQDGVQELFAVLTSMRAINTKDRQSSFDIVELAAACLAELLQLENCVSLCEAGVDDLFEPDVFDILLKVLLAPEVSADSPHRKATLLLLLSLLHEFPDVSSAALHEAAMEDQAGGHERLYRQMVHTSMQESWTGGAVKALICALLEAASIETEVYNTVIEALTESANEGRDEANQDASTFISDLQDSQAQHTSLRRQVLADAASATAQALCTALERELEMRQRSPFGGLDKEDSGMSLRLKKLEDEVRRANNAMRAMAKAVDVGQHPILKDSLEAIVRFGFDQVKWKNNMTALHYAAAQVENPAILELFCHLSPDLDAPDANGRTPSDYARVKRKRQWAINQIDAVREARDERTRTFVNTFVGAPVSVLDVPTMEFAPLDASMKTNTGNTGILPSVATPTKQSELAPVMERTNSAKSVLSKSDSQKMIKSDSQRSVKWDTSVQDKEKSSQPGPPAQPRLPSATVESAPVKSSSRKNLAPGPLNMNPTESMTTMLEKEALRAAADRLRGYLHKYPTTGKGFWAKTNKRFFAIKYIPVPPPGKKDPFFELGYWESEEEMKENKDSKRMIAIDSINEVEEGNNVSVFSIKHLEQGNLKELKVVAKDGFGLPSAQEAKRWIDGLRAFMSQLSALRQRNVDGQMADFIAAAPGPSTKSAKDQSSSSSPRSPPLSPQKASQPSTNSSLQAAESSLAMKATKSEPQSESAADGERRSRSHRRQRLSRGSAISNATAGAEKNRAARGARAVHARQSRKSMGRSGSQRLLGRPSQAKTVDFVDDGGAIIRIQSRTPSPRQHGRTAADDKSLGQSKSSPVLPTIKTMGSSAGATLQAAGPKCICGSNFMANSHFCGNCGKRRSEVEAAPLVSPRFGRACSSVHTAASATRHYTIGSLTGSFSDAGGAASQPLQRFSISSMTGRDLSALAEGDSGQGCDIERLYDDLAWVECANGLAWYESSRKQCALDLMWPNQTLGKSLVDSLPSALIGMRTETIFRYRGGDSKIRGLSAPAAELGHVEPPEEQEGRARRFKSEIYSEAAKQTSIEIRSEEGRVLQKEIRSITPGQSGQSTPRARTPPGHPRVNVMLAADVEARMKVLSAPRDEPEERTPTQGKGRKGVGKGAAKAASVAVDAGWEEDTAGLLLGASSENATEADSGATNVVPKGKSKGKGPKGPSPVAPSQCIDAPAEAAPGSEASAAAAAPSGTNGKGKGKGKGKNPQTPAPPADVGTAPAEAEPSAQPKKGKGKAPKGAAEPEAAAQPKKGKGKGPKGPAEPEQGAAEPKKGKGKGPKAPPPPGAKAPEGGKGKGKDSAGQPTKEKVTPARAMKPLWWQRFLFEKDLKKGETIWDIVRKGVEWKVPDDVMLERFSKAAGNEPKKLPEKKETKEALSQIRIIKDPNIIVGTEAAIRSAEFPAPSIVADALLRMDARVITAAILGILKERLCPDPSQITQLEESRKEHPDVPFAAPESVMWAISRVPFFNARVDCWFFIRSYEEHAIMCTTSLSQFQRVLDSFLNSTALPCVMALILAIGNFLNGGSNRGQADGFDLESINKLDSIKDATNDANDVRNLVAEYLFLGHVKGLEPLEDFDGNDDQLVGDRLLQELKSAFSAVSRAITRDSDGCFKVVKQVRVSLEDSVDCVKTLVKDFQEQNNKLQICLETSEDPADPLRLELADLFANANQHVNRLKDQAEKAQAGFGRLMAYFHHKGMESTKFIMLWDDLLVPSNLLLNKPEAIRKREVVPRFCTPNRALLPDDLLFLWELGVKRRPRRARPQLRKLLKGEESVARPKAVARIAQQWRARAREMSVTSRKKTGEAFDESIVEESSDEDTQKGHG